MISRTKSFVFPLTVIVLSLSLAACGNKDKEEGKAATQVVAKVNGDEISIHQLNYQMSRLGQVDQAQAKAASRQVLNRLVDQQLLVQKSMEAKLDRDPKVMQTIEAARREILAQAYMEQQLGAAKKPSQQEMDDFYTKHPELFEKRRIYRLQEIAVAAGRDKLADVEAGVKAAKSLNEIADWLKKNNYQFSANSNVRAAEQLPLELLPRLQQMKDGELVIIPTEQSINIVILAASQEQPVSKDKAAPLIEKYFVNQNKAELAKKAMEKLRAEAKIEYLGDFADMKAEAGKTSGPAKAEESSRPAAAAAEKPAPKAEAKVDESIQKGLSGL